MNILFIFNNCKSIQNIFDLVIKLSKKNQIYYYLNYQTSRTIVKSEVLYKEKDTLLELISILQKNNCIKIGESQTTHFNSIPNILYINKCLQKIKKIHFCIMDDSNGIEKGNQHGFNIIYQILKKKFKSIKIIGNIEGIKDFNVKKNNIYKRNTQLESICKSVNICYDYINCFSKYQYDILCKNNNLNNKILKCGFPYLDKLKEINKIEEIKEKNLENKYLLFFTSSIDKNGKWEVMDDKTILKINTIALEYNLKLVIKEKPRNTYTYKHLENENILVSMCEGEELDKLISQSKYIISSPSTVLLRCLILQKPFLILNDKYYGQLGLFNNYKYLINNINEISETLNNFDYQYLNKFLKENLFGYQFNSIDLYINKLKTL